MLRIFNSVEPRIQFTCEREKDCVLPFLDMNVYRCVESHSFYTNWYRKPIASGRLLNYNSLHPLNQKIGTVVGFIDRVNRLSDTRFLEANKRMISETLLANYYPRALINRLLQRHLVPRVNPGTAANDTPTQPTTVNNIEANTTKRYFSLPYIPRVSEKITRCIKSVMTNAEISMRSFKNVGRYFTRLKDPTPKMMQSNVVYSVPCGDCDDKCYIGTTSQLLKTRMGQHASDVRNNKPDKSALAHHALTNEHVFKFDEVKIIGRNDCYRKRMFLEELHIKASGTCVNFKSKETKKVESIYTKLLEKCNNVSARRNSPQSLSNEHMISVNDDDA